MFNYLPIIIMLQNVQKRNKRHQNTFCYCPNCKSELISNNSYKKDTDFVYFKCSQSGTLIKNLEKGKE